MSLTIVGETTFSVNDNVLPVVSIKQAFSDEWEQRPDIEVRNMSLHAASSGTSSCVLVRRYGSVMRQGKTSFDNDVPLSLDGWWAMIQLVTEQSSDVAWIGRIVGEGRRVFGSTGDSLDVATGTQEWQAYGPEHILTKRTIATSRWDDVVVHIPESIPGGGSQNVLIEKPELGWVPSFNTRDSRNLIVGNRSSSLRVTYVFGGTDTWTRLQAVEYILHHYAQHLDKDTEDVIGPTWFVSGQVEVLRDATDAVPMQQSQTVRQALDRLIPPSLGVGWKIIPIGPPATLVGFEIFIFALSDEEVVFRSATLPANPNPLLFSRALAGADATEVDVSWTVDVRYHTLKVAGERIVVCQEFSEAKGNLEPRWSAAAETEYKAGTGVEADAGSDHDKARTRDAVDDVYAVFGVPKDLAVLPPSIRASDDEVVGYFGVPPHLQTTVRRTLPWTPLQSGIDYSFTQGEPDPPVDNNTAGVVGALLPPRVWVKDATTGRYTITDAGISANQLDWGLKIQYKPNHLLALNHFDDANDTRKDPEFDYSDMIVTFAVETDQRHTLISEIADPDTGDGSVLTILVPGAHFWYLAPNVAVGVKPDGTIARSPGILDVSIGGGLVLRNDGGKLDAVMAGAISRYFKARGRATMTFRGTRPFSELLGFILSAIDDGVGTDTIKAPITSVSWTFGEGAQTVIKAGFAR